MLIFEASGITQEPFALYKPFVSHNPVEQSSFSEQGSPNCDNFVSFSNIITTLLPFEINDKLYIVGKPRYNINNELKFIERYNSSISTSLGYKSDEEIMAYFLECDFVVLPYKEASQSGVLITALSLGKPVITTNVGGLPEVVEMVNGGHVVEPNNPILLCKALNKFSEITDSKLAEWSSDIRKKTLTNYSWDNIAKLTLNFYNKIRSI